MPDARTAAEVKEDAMRLREHAMARQVTQRENRHGGEREWVGREEAIQRARLVASSISTFSAVCLPVPASPLYVCVFQLHVATPKPQVLVYEKAGVLRPNEGLQ
eukprot:763339-Hanusia_phi.AAC.2